MCGIVGLVKNDNFPVEWEAMLKSMADKVTHRGPDSDGIWFDADIGIGLAHRRLAIIDLSSEGHQPMFSETMRYVVVFNGEIYNYQTLRDELIKLKYQFRGQSDTEVILAAVDKWGIKDAVSRFIGMFAIALWDRHTRNLYLIRDRMGEKPLYYGKIGRAIVFSSELKALKAYPHWEGNIDHAALAIFMQRGYVPAPHSIYHGIKKLSPGTILTIDLSRSEPSFSEQLYWSMDNVLLQGQENTFIGSENEMVYGLEQLLLDSINQQMISDVPLGAFLSGGIDSSTVVALMQSISSRPIETFSIGFNDVKFDEAGYARKVARHLGTHHTELYVNNDEMLRVVPKLPTIYDEPFADSSQIPTYLVSELARHRVTVSLSGDGGDELFCGYPRYYLVNDLWKKISYFPQFVRCALANCLLHTKVERLDSVFKWLNPVFSKYSHAGRAGDKIKKAADLLYADNMDEFYSLLTSNWTHVDDLLVDKNAAQKILTTGKKSQSFSSHGNISHMMYLDSIGYLPDDILVKLDRASMANSLETRIPLLDHRIVEYAWQLPLSVKYKNGQGKWILKQILYKYVPKALFERPKKGFGVPLQEWLIGPLLQWAEELLNEKRLRQEGFFNPELIREKWLEHKSGKRNWKSQLWCVLVFQAWLENQKF